MIKNVVKSLFCCFLFWNCEKENINLKPNFLQEIDFVKTVGGTKNEVANSVVATNDGGYAILGYTQSNDMDFSSKIDDSFDFVVLKYSAEDTLEWHKTYGGSKDDRGNKIIPTNDGGYAVLGYTKSNDLDITNNAGDRDYWLVKLNSTGNISWQKNYGYSGRDFGTSLIQTADNGFLIVGELDVTASGGQGNIGPKVEHAGGDFWAIKTSASGTIEWSRYYGGTFTDTPFDVLETKEGDFILVGTSDSSDVDISNNKGTYDFWVVKINSTGTILWEKNFGGSEIDEAKGIAITNDNHFLIVGNSRSNDGDITSTKGGADLWLIKIDSSGNMIWNKNYGGTGFDVGNNIRRTSDGNYLIAGSSRSADNSIVNKGQNDAWVLKISAEGSLLWQETIGGSEIDFCYDAVELSNGTIIGVGESTSNSDDIPTNKGFSDLLLFKLK